METTDNSFRIMTWVIISLLALSAAGAIYYWDESRDIGFAKEKVSQRFDSLLASKSQLEKESSNLTNQLETVRTKNQLLADQVAESDGLLNQQETVLRNLKNSNIHLTTLRDTLQSDLAGLKEQTERITGENQGLADKNNQLSTQVEAMNKELAMKVPRSVVTADGFRVEAVKPNDKVTAKAKKVHSLTVSFNVPGALGLEGTQEVYLSLNGLQNNNLIKPMSTAIIDLGGTSQTIPVYAVKKVDFSKGSQPVSLTFESTDGFEPQTYRASVFTKEAYLGSVEFKFRDSFWFF